MEISVRSRRLVLGTIATGCLAAALLLWPAGPLCACTPALDTPITPSLGRVFRDLDVAEQRVRQATGRYARHPGELQTVPLPLEVRVLPLLGSDSTYRLRVDSGVSAERSCVIAGGRDAAGTARAFTVDCRSPVT
jgi:hypothetical protein